MDRLTDPAGTRPSSTPPATTAIGAALAAAAAAVVVALVTAPVLPTDLRRDASVAPAVGDLLLAGAVAVVALASIPTWRRWLRFAVPALTTASLALLALTGMASSRPLPAGGVLVVAVAGGTALAWQHETWAVGAGGQIRSARVVARGLAAGLLLALALVLLFGAREDGSGESDRTGSERGGQLADDGEVPADELALSDQIEDRPTWWWIVIGALIVAAVAALLVARRTSASGDDGDRLARALAALGGPGRPPLDGESPVAYVRSLVALDRVGPETIELAELLETHRYAAPRPPEQLTAARRLARRTARRRRLRTLTRRLGRERGRAASMVT